MEKKGAHNSHATASENGANHGFIWCPTVSRLNSKERCSLYGHKLISVESGIRTRLKRKLKDLQRTDSALKQRKFTVKENRARGDAHSLDFLPQHLANRCLDFRRGFGAHEGVKVLWIDV